ncbi:dipeptide ABC transporter ATP-binding protein [Acidimicrobiaceae bacterium USS-CC1]|uniref:Dipeptide ABC transporter ATP-binding protein n=1 Tax=Acidiferrimicrobium australe TaxID=2664430 RepID=A0ABW9QUC2_9ACTN|nr:dipeptide ABC transporter ATP-binding protein [Acidiferrimicrobium australe]
MPPILEVVDLSTHIQLTKSVVQAVDHVSFHLDAGETLGLVGESGSGKSMTGLSVMGLLPNGGHIVGGSIKLEGRELVGMPAGELRSLRGNEIAMIFQDSASSLNPTKTIGDQVAEPVMLHRKASKKEALDRAVEVLTLVGLPRPKERLGDYPHQLSGGLRQRVMIAMALTCDPKVLIADEPTTALDVTIQAQILALLDDLKQQLGMAVLLVTHDMGVVAGRADRVNVMYAGHIVETADTDELFRSMHHPYTQGLLASIPRLDQDNRRRLYSIPGVPPDLTSPPPGCRYAPRCPHADEKCVADEPPLAEGGPDFTRNGEGWATPGHAFACWHPVDGPVDIVEGADQGSAEAPTQGEALLEVNHVVKEYPVTAGAILQRKVGSVKAVSDVAVRVGKGEIYGLVGESGCGKTTLGKVIVGLEPPNAGKVLLEDRDVFSARGRSLRRQRRELQMMFQDPYSSLDPRMRVGAILREPLEIQGVGSRQEQDQRIAELLQEVGLPANATERYPHEFSGGQRQRIGLARALTLNPRVIVADEPVSALDVSIRSQVLNLMRRLQASHGQSYVVISHDLAVVKYLSDRIGVMYLGKLVEEGSGDDIYHRPAHPYTAALIDTIPVPDPSVERSKTEVGIRGELPSPVNPPSGCRFRTRCPRAQQRCADEEPALRGFGTGHVAACHFPLQEPLEPAAAGSSAAAPVADS